MKAEILLFSVLCAFFVQPADYAAAFVTIASLEDQVAQADAVVIAKPVRLTKLPTTTDDMIYEFGEFRIQRSLVRENDPGLWTVNMDDHTVGVLRLWHESSVDFEDFTRQDFDKDREYVLILNKTGVDGCYRLVERFQKLMPANEKTLKRVFKAMYGDEREPLAVEPMAVDDALALARGVLQRTAKGIDPIFKLDDDAFLELAFDGTDEQRHATLQRVFGPMKNNRRVVSIVAMPEKSYKSERGSSSGFISYHALAREKYEFSGRLTHDTDLFGRKWKRLVEEKDIEAFVMPSETHGRLLIARRIVDSPRGPVTIEAAIKIGEGGVGIPRDIDLNAEARKNKAAYEVQP